MCSYFRILSHVYVFNLMEYGINVTVPMRGGQCPIYITSSTDFFSPRKFLREVPSILFYHFCAIPVLKIPGLIPVSLLICMLI